MRELLYWIIGLGMLPPLILFVVYYRLSPWRSTVQGIALMTQKIAMITLLAHSLLLNVVQYPGAIFVHIALLIVLSGAFWAVFFSLRSAQRSPKVRAGRFINRRGFQWTNKNGSDDENID